MKISMAAARVNANMTQQQAADSLGVAKGTYASYENGKTQPTLEMAEKISSLFGLSLDMIKFKH